jgi:putative phosphonate metabolism protein
VAALVPRYALYFAPPVGSTLSAVGQAWLGRDCLEGRPVGRLGAPGFSAEQLAGLTERPRHYGFHATLKPPFRLARHCGIRDFHERLAEFARQRRPIDLPPLRLGALGDFIALLPSTPCPTLNRLAADCVREFDGFRSPPEEDELVGRRSTPLTARQWRLLCQWGYPYVMEEFRFHITLTGPIEKSARQKLLSALRPVLRPILNLPVQIDSVSLFMQADPSSPFLEADRFPFGTGTGRRRGSQHG